MWTWLDTHASAIQAISAVVVAAETVALIGITALYVRLTGALAETANAQLRMQAEALAARRSELAADVQLLREKLQLLPQLGQEQQLWTMIRESISIPWDEFDFGRFRTLASELSPRAASAAAAVESHMKVLPERITLIRDLRTGAPFDSRGLDWRTWNNALLEVPAALEAISRELGSNHPP